MPKKPTPIKFSAVKIIHNPNSTGDAPKLAKETYKTLAPFFGKENVELLQTKRAGHAEELAYSAAKRYSKPLIISVSGDGGYHEVVNGVMKAKKGAVISVIGAGNANDHYNAAVKKPIADLVQDQPEVTDLLKVSITHGTVSTIRYAHSYCGLGISPKIAEELNRYKLNLFKEIRILMRALVSDRPVSISRNGRKEKVESLLFANIPRMAKVLRLSGSSSLSDSKFETVKIPL